MALVALPGTPLVPIGPGYTSISSGAPNSTGSTIMDAAVEAVISIGHVVTSDGGSHTIDTTGSSSLGWLTDTCTFASASTTVKVGLAAVDTAAGPPGRAVHVTNTITFDVSKSLIGGGGGITSAAWQTHVPDTGSKTIANGDLVAFCVQMISRGGTDSIMQNCRSVEHSRPLVTAFTGSYLNQSFVPNAIITFADGALGFFYSGEVYSAQNSIAFNSGSATKEYGQLFNLPFPLKIYGIYGWASISSGAANFDVVAYSAPLSGTPVAEKTVSVDGNTTTSVSARKLMLLFPTPYTYVANTDIAVAFKPAASNITVYYKTLASAAHRIADPFGISGYGISRASGAFANANSSLDHYYIGLLAGAFDAGGPAGRAVQINNDSLVA